MKKHFILLSLMILCSVVSSCSVLDSIGPKPAQPDPCASQDTIFARSNDTSFKIGHCRNVVIVFGGR